MNPNDYQIAGDHYRRAGKVQHWDLMLLLNADYFIGCASKYVYRFENKNGLQDLEKACHFMAKRGNKKLPLMYRLRLFWYSNTIINWLNSTEFHTDPFLDTMSKLAFNDVLFGKSHNLLALTKEYKRVTEHYR